MNWARQSKLEDAYYEMHSIRPEVYYWRENNNTYKVRLVLNGKEAIITENLQDGLTQSVILEINNIVIPCKSVYGAEVKANELLRS
jgi:hypothetical protein